MPAALTLHERREIVERGQTGESLAAIARELAVSYGAVYKIYRRYVETGQLVPNYERCRHTSVRKDGAIYEQAVALKQAHPTWGAGLIWVELADEFEEERLPSIRTLQRWFRRAGVQPVRRERVAREPIKRGQRPHEVWAVDAKEQVVLEDGTRASWLTITDEGSGAMLDVSLFPHQAVDGHRAAAGEAGSAGGDDGVGTS
ncbi:MAG: helix-turn-helix domain-containing protein [Anaerolineae bacterium]|jgi:''Paired box'' domain.|nr:helix-turn-helix domain-containing protein [Anaerolineae bacterium]